MLTVTETATDAIRQLVDNSETDAQTAGVRIAAGETTEQGTTLSLALAEGPQPGDEVVPGDASVFLEPKVAEVLEDTVLDAQVNDGEVAFALRDPTQQPSRNGSGPD